jgi:hypothetical protein
MHTVSNTQQQRQQGVLSWEAMTMRRRRKATAHPLTSRLVQVTPQRVRTAGCVWTLPSQVCW